MPLSKHTFHFTISHATYYKNISTLVQYKCITFIHLSCSFPKFDVTNNLDKNSHLLIVHYQYNAYLNFMGRYCHITWT